MSNARSLANFGGIISGLTGEVKMWPLNTAPNGYLICNGQAVRRADYAALYAAIGTTFGAGDGASTFNLPNYTDRMPVGKGNIASNIGSVGGSKDSVVPSHTHIATDSGHTHNTTLIGRSGNSAWRTRTPGWAQDDGTTENLTVTSASGVSNITVSTVGQSPTGANMPPYIGINFIIKY